MKYSLTKMAPTDVLTDRLNAYIPAIITHYEIPGLSISVVKDNATVFAKGFGVIDRKSGCQVTEKTRFGVGSITKGFTSALVANLLQTRKE